MGLISSMIKDVVKNKDESIMTAVEKGLKKMGRAVEQQYNFLGDIVYAVEFEGTWYFFPKLICEIIGIGWTTQQKKIQRAKGKYKERLIPVLRADKKMHKMLGIPIDTISTWVRDIEIGRVKPECRKSLQRYHDELDRWMTEAGFLGMAVNTQVVNLPIEQQHIMLDQAVERARAADKKYQELGYDDEVRAIIALPDYPGMEPFKVRRLQQLVDLQHGFVRPADIGKRIVLSDHTFYERYIIEGDCDDKIISIFEELATPEEVQAYAQRLGLRRLPLQTPDLSAFSHTQKAQMVKGYRQFHYPIRELVRIHNLPAQLIRDCIQDIEWWLLGIFHKYELALGPDPIDWDLRKARYRRYMKSLEWKFKREAYFSIFNCCVDCPPEVGWEIVSKNFEAHHFHYQTVGKEHPWDLVPLCGECHQKREKKRGRSFYTD